MIHWIKYRWKKLKRACRLFVFGYKTCDCCPGYHIVKYMIEDLKRAEKILADKHIYVNTPEYVKQIRRTRMALELLRKEDMGFDGDYGDRDPTYSKGWRSMTKTQRKNFHKKQYRWERETFEYTMNQFIKYRYNWTL